MKLKYKGTPDKLVIIAAWKKNVVEPLIHNKILIGFTSDGKNYAIDLVKPEKVQDGKRGDIRVTFTRPLNAKYYKTKIDWSVTIEGIGGGLIETDDVFMNEAPKFGYQKKWRLEMKADDSDYQFEAKRKFYLKSRNGKVYGRLEFEFIPIYNDQSVINARWWLNPNGSRNLQRSENDITSHRY